MSQTSPGKHRKTAAVQLARRMTASSRFEYGIACVILLNAVIIGLSTWKPYAAYHSLFEAVNALCLAIFIAEMLVRMAACSPNPLNYFRSGWNIFDFSIIFVSLLLGAGGTATVVRIFRLLRVLRLITVIPELRLITATMLRSLPSLLNISVLMSIIFYIYAVIGYDMFHEVDPEHWRHLGVSARTLLGIMTLESWTEIMSITMEHNPWALLYFLSFVLLGAFVVVNIFIAVVVNNIDQARRESLLEGHLPLTQEALMSELLDLRQALEDLKTQLKVISEKPRE